MTNLASALADLRAEIENGASLADVAAEIAAEYGVNPTLLTRKFEESYGSVEGVRATAAVTSVPAKVEQQIAKLCAQFGVSRDRVTDSVRGGVRYAIIGRLSTCRTLPLLAVSYADGRAYRVA